MYLLYIDLPGVPGKFLFFFTAGLGVGLGLGFGFGSWSANPLIVEAIELKASGDIIFCYLDGFSKLLCIYPKLGKGKKKKTN